LEEFFNTNVTGVLLFYPLQDIRGFLRKKDI